MAIKLKYEKAIINFFVLLILLFFSLSRTASVQADDPLPEYIISPGDSLSTISMMFGVPVDEIIQVNNLSNPNSIKSGDVLRIPISVEFEGQLIKKAIPFGQNLSSIILSLDIPYEFITSLNRITSPMEVYAGSEIVIPVRDDTNLKTPIMQVAEGSILLESAFLLEMNPWELIINNNLSNAADLSLNQLLYGNKEQGDGFSPISPIISQITLSPLPLIQGKTHEFSVVTEKEAEISITFDNNIYTLEKISPNNHVAFIGVPALAEPGIYPIHVSGNDNSGSKINYSQSVLLNNGNYTDEYVLGVDPNTIDLLTIDSEEEILKSINGSSPFPLWSGQFSYPVDSPCLSSRFGTRRSYNDGQYNYYHTGQDFKVCADNLNIYSSSNGIVKYVGLLPIKGNFTLIDHGLGIYSGYAHQSKVFVNVGDSVEMGQLIGEIGNTGRSVGPHLHWEIWVNHVPVDPIDWIVNSYPFPDIPK